MDVFYNVFNIIQRAWNFTTKLIWDAFENCFQTITDIKKQITMHLTNLYILIVFIFKLLSPSIYTFGLACNIIALFLNTVFGTIDFFVNIHINTIAFFMDITSFIFLTVINFWTSLYYLLGMIYSDNDPSSTTQTIAELSADDTEAREIEHCEDSQNLQAILSEERNVFRPSEPSSIDHPPSTASPLVSIHETPEISFSDSKPLKNVQKSPQKDNTVNNLDPASEGMPSRDLSLERLPSPDLSPEGTPPFHDLAPEVAQSSDFASEDTKQSDLAPEGATESDLTSERSPSHHLSPEGVPPSHDFTPEGAQSSADFASEDIKQSDLASEDIKQSDLAPEGATQSDLAPEGATQSDFAPEPESLPQCDITTEGVPPSDDIHEGAESFDNLTLEGAPSLDVLEGLSPADAPLPPADAPAGLLPADDPTPENVSSADRENVRGNIKLPDSEGHSGSFGDGSVARSDLISSERFSETPLALEEEISTASNEQIILDDITDTERILVIDIPGNNETGDEILVDKSKSGDSVGVEPQYCDEHLEPSNRPDAPTSGETDHGDDKILDSALALTPIGSTADHEYRQIAFISPQIEQTSEVIADDFLKDDSFIDSNGRGKLSENLLVEQPVDAAQISEHSHEICAEERTSPVPLSLEVAAEQHSRNSEKAVEGKEETGGEPSIDEHLVEAES